VIIARYCDIIEEDVILCGFEDEEEKQVEKTQNDSDKTEKKERTKSTDTNQKEEDTIKHLKEENT